MKIRLIARVADYVERGDYRGMLLDETLGGDRSGVVNCAIRLLLGTIEPSSTEDDRVLLAARLTDMFFAAVGLAGQEGGAR